MRVDHPDGTFIAYTYDSGGDILSIETPGGTTRYEYDALRRLETVTDKDLGVTMYGYDEIGRRQSLTYPNGTSTVYDYDELHRLTLVEQRAPDLSVFARYQYTLDAAGNRTQILQHDGRVINYTYDNLHRLTREESTAGLLPDRAIDHAYNAVSNRVVETVEGSSVVFAYDDNDRLLAKGSTTYVYDDDGNTLSRQDASGTTAYDYDAEDRLVSVDGPSGLSSYGYDVDGNRIMATEAGVSTHFLVDANRDHAQVIEERDGLHNLQAHFAWGSELIGQERGGSFSYYHSDGHGSIRQLTDSLGDVSDTFDYDAYGGLQSRTGATVNNHLYAGEQFVPGLGGYYLPEDRLAAAAMRPSPIFNAIIDGMS